MLIDVGSEKYEKPRHTKPSLGKSHETTEFPIVCFAQGQVDGHYYKKADRFLPRECNSVGQNHSHEELRW